MWVSPSEANCSHRFFQFSSAAALPGFGFQRSDRPAVAETGVSPKSVKTRLAAARLSVLRKSSSAGVASSTSRMPARAQPSSDFRYPAPAEVVWCIQRVILWVAGAARDTVCSKGTASISLRVIIAFTIYQPPGGCCSLSGDVSRLKIRARLDDPDLRGGALNAPAPVLPVSVLIGGQPATRGPRWSSSRPSRVDIGCSRVERH